MTPTLLLLLAYCDARGLEQPVAQEKSPKKTANKQAKEVTLEKTDPVANLRKAIRSTSQVVGVSMNTGEIKVLK